MIYEILPQGAENAVTGSTLIKFVGLDSVRDLQKMIAQERSEGMLILSSSKSGYFRPDEDNLEKGKHEIAEFVNVLRMRAINTLRAIQAAKKALEQTEGQIGLNERDQLNEG